MKDENDSRAYQIYATEKAKNEFDRQKQQQNELTERLKSSLAEDEIEAFCLTCGKIISFLESEYPEVSTGIDGHGRHYCRGRSHHHGLGNDLRCDSFRKVMSLSIEQAEQFTTGSLVTRMTNDIAMVVEFVEQLLRFWF